MNEVLEGHNIVRILDAHNIMTAEREADVEKGVSVLRSYPK